MAPEAVALAGGGRGPTGGRVALQWIDHHQAAQHHRHQKDQPVDHEYALHPRQAEHVSGVEQAAKPGAGQLNPDGRAEAETRHSQSCDQAFLVWKPLDANCDGHDIDQSDAGALQDADEHQLCPERVPEQAA